MRRGLGAGEDGGGRGCRVRHVSASPWSVRSNFFARRSAVGGTIREGRGYQREIF